MLKREYDIISAAKKTIKNTSGTREELPLPSIVCLGALELETRSSHKSMYGFMIMKKYDLEL